MSRKETTPSRPAASAKDGKTATPTGSTKPPGFKEYLWKIPQNKKYLLAALGINLVLFIIYKYSYPLPDFCTDAQGYIHAAVTDDKSYYRPFGYSRFLQIVHNFTESHYATVAIQYFFAVLAGLFSFFSLDYLFPFRNSKIKFASWLLVTVNPIILVLSNLMVSDILFVALSTIWFTLLLWIIKKKEWWSLAVQLLFLYWAFQVRYNALYYPVVAAVVFLMLPGTKLYYRLTGVIASFLVIYGAHSMIKKTNYENTGTEVFAGFSGWQMANNALHIYKKANVQLRDFNEPDLQRLDTIVKLFIDSVKADISKPTADFIWDRSSPLKKYVFYHASTNRMPYLQAWYAVSPLYSEYGSQIIKRNPGLYIKDYMLPNFYLYVTPPAEILGTYDYSKSGLASETKEWLHIDQTNLTANVPGVQEKLMAPYPALHAILFVFWLVMPLIYLLKCRKQQGAWNPDFLVPVLFWYLFLGIDTVFSCFAAQVTLRYLAIQFIVGFGLPLLFLDRFLQKDPEATAA